MDAFYKIKLVCTCSAGVSIGEAAREGALLALTENRKVEFAHNGTPVSIDPEEIVSWYTAQWSRERALAQSQAPHD
jgi:hypothetical protein